MKNVELKINNNIYGGNNHFHPEFIKSIVESLYSGIPLAHKSISANISTSSYSINSTYILTEGFFSKDNRPLSSLTSNTVGIYSFPNNGDSEVTYGDLASINNINGYPIKITDIKGTIRYNLSNIDDYSFKISQLFHYSATGNETDPIRFGSLSLKNNLYATSGGNTYSYMPVVYINMNSFSNFNRQVIYPSEVLEVNWIVSCNTTTQNDSELNIGSTVNVDKNTNIRANIHDQFRKILKNILYDSSVSFGSSGDSMANFKISNIMAFESPNDAMNNNSTSYLFNRPLTITKYGDYTIVVKQRYTNETGTFKKIGSLLLGSSIQNGISFIPVSWVNASSIWGQDIRIVDPNETIEIIWTLNFLR